MAFLDFFRKTQNNIENKSWSELLEAVLGRDLDISVKQALSIPAVASSVEKISSIVASVPFRLYRDEIKNGVKKTEEVEDDRTFMLNVDTGDLLDGFMFKKALVHDYLLYGNGYAYINRKLNATQSLNYVKADEVIAQKLVGKSVDGKPVGAIYKQCNFMVEGVTYNDMDFFRLLRSSGDGMSGLGIVGEINNVLSTILSAEKYFNKIAKTGGIKKGFLESEVTLTDPQLKKLRESWNRLYEENKENVVILNKGVKYKEASQTAAEAQLNDLKSKIESAVKDVFGIYDDHDKFIKETIAPILTAFETALNKYLLLESEKGVYHFSADTKELLKPTLKERADAYTILKKAGVMSTNDIRYALDLPETKGGDVLSGNLGDVTINPLTGEAIVFNTGAKFNLETFEVVTPPPSEQGETNE